MIDITIPDSIFSVILWSLSHSNKAITFDGSIVSDMLKL